MISSLYPSHRRRGEGEWEEGVSAPRLRERNFSVQTSTLQPQKSRGKELGGSGALGQDKGEWHSLCRGQGHMSASCETAVDYMGEREPAWSHVGS